MGEVAQHLMYVCNAQQECIKITQLSQELVFHIEETASELTQKNVMTITQLIVMDEPLIVQLKADGTEQAEIALIKIHEQNVIRDFTKIQTIHRLAVLLIEETG